MELHENSTGNVQYAALVDDTEITGDVTGSAQHAIRIEEAWVTAGDWTVDQSAEAGRVVVDDLWRTGAGEYDPEPLLTDVERIADRPPCLEGENRSVYVAAAKAAINNLREREVI